MIMTLISIIHYSFFLNLQVFYWPKDTIYNNDNYYHYYYIKMSNIFELKTLENKDFEYPLPRKYERVKILYHNLINSGYTSCQAFHEAMKLLTIINPHIKLSEVSKKTINIIYPIYDNYYENNIDNHSQN